MSIKPCNLKTTIDNREEAIRGTPMFPCGAYFTDINKEFNGEITWHWHDEIETLIVQSGVLNIKLSEKSYILHEGEGAFINSGVLHSAHIHNSSNCILSSFVFQPSFIYGTTESIIEQRYMKPLTNSCDINCVEFKKSINWQSQALQCILSAYEHYKREDFGYEFLVRENLSHVCYLIIKNMPHALEQHKQFEKNDSLRVKQMLNFIHKYYGEPLELKEIADVSNISTRECLRCFKSTINTPPMQYLIKYRISVAARLLCETNKTITEICSICGFESPSYFSKMFKKFMSFTPKSYRLFVHKND